ncbi:MAG TPA: DNA polymerase III subunit gamma/tau [Isosphaeraceae bacterium]|nr:DNA polymerase III subunit gamma/tau [Isosphaeraceae bacterium]
MAEPAVEDAPARSEPAPYTVVARRYRPQRFEDVVGQDHVVRSLRNAIRLNRIAQAYLFCGTRGVGKTTLARIFAKCLNCVHGPTEQPCQVCDICQAIAQGQDVDVIEIDGASNNGVEQVRELRQNAALRPSRARFKIYYIDEVHMLSTGAFNALLKTLEEPPPHVKFFFATTEANKIPITVLSRCQRYDLAGITPELIAKALAEICTREGVDAEPEALQVVARRAGGSLRDAQSLLDRLLASGSARLTVAIVHSWLGTASDERLLAMLEALAGHDAAAALVLLDQAAGEGVQPAELLGGLIDFLRDVLVLALGADSLVLAVSPRQRPRLDPVIARWPVDSILAALQILAEHRARLRGSLHGRLLVELALCRVARLEDLQPIGALVERLSALESGTVPVRPPQGIAPRKKLGGNEGPAGPASRAPQAAAPSLASGPQPKAEPSGGGDAAARVPAPAAPMPAQPAASPPRAPSGAEAPQAEHRDGLPPLELEAVQRVWPDLAKAVKGKFGWRLSAHLDPIAVEPGDVLVLAPKPGYNSEAEVLATPEVLQSLELGLERLLHRVLSVRYEPAAARGVADLPPRPPASRVLDTMMADPMVQKVVELFEARSVQVDYDDREPLSST